ncbi:Polysaccharide pyruvyl transferase [compost metagenome]
MREDILAEDIKSLASDLNSRVVVDPSLLINDYSQIENCQRIPECDYIVTYVVGSGETLEKFNEYIKILKKKLNLPVYHIGAKSIESADHNLLDVGPDEWVAFIRSAKFVGTNSFHGTAFSVNFEKQFLFFPHAVENLNTRQTTLLKRIDLLDRLIPTPSALATLRIEKIDYSKVTPKLRGIISESKDFLLSALN